MSAEKCGKCGKGVYPLEKVIACEKSWHKGCFRCKHCDMVLSLKGFATIEGDPYCKPHYLELFKSKGNYKVFSGDSSSSSYNSTLGFKGMDAVLTGVTQPAHLKHANTVDKSAPVIDNEVKIKKIDRQGLLTEIEKPHELKHAEVVDHSAPVIENVVVKKVDRRSFIESIQKGPEKPLQKPDAVADYSSPKVRIANSARDVCYKCNQSVYPLEKLVACDKPWHKGCFRCKHCDMVLSLKGFATIEGEPYCKPHYMEIFKTKGNYRVFSGEGGSSSFNSAGAFQGVK